MKRRYYYLPIAAGVLIPSFAIFILEVFVAKMSPFKSILDILSRQFAKGENLFLLMVLSFIPFGVLMFITYELEVKVNEKQLDCIFWGGFVSVFGLTLDSHIRVWYPLYSGSHFSSTSSIAFCILPVLCIGIMVIGMLIGWGISFLPIFKSGRKDN